MPGKSVGESRSAGHRRIGIFGGTFDPVHLGHLRMASEIASRLALDEMRLMPAQKPPHRSQPLASADQRWQMLSLALPEFPGLRADDRELKRRGPSYSYDSVRSILDEEPGSRLAFCMGWDSLVSFTSWHRWQELLELCCLVAVDRPHHHHNEEDVPEPLRPFRASRQEGADLKAGCILELEIEPVPVSASQVRAQVERGERPDLVPEAVVAYINEHQLYKSQ